jgi:hypothetical protein
MIGLVLFIGRGDRIRTCDFFVPNEARYRAALHPATNISVYQTSMTLSKQRPLPARGSPCAV